MDDRIPREWLHPSSLKEASAVQRQLAERVTTEDRLGPVETVAGVDVSQKWRDPEGIIFAAVVLLEAATMRVVGAAHATRRSDFPYVPGFLGFREVPCLLDAFARLPAMPDLVFVDGHGVSHPRRLGIATHLGVLIDRPTIGVAKSILVGRPAGELPPEPGSRVPLEWRGEEIGLVLRTKLRVNPVYVSTGHRVALPTAAEWVMRAAKGYRLPEPTRQAHLSANEFRRTQ
jgi:deoxyribonuclease V